MIIPHDATLAAVVKCSAHLPVAGPHAPWRPTGHGARRAANAYWLAHEYVGVGDLVANTRMANSNIEELPCYHGASAAKPGAWMEPEAGSGGPAPCMPTGVGLSTSFHVCRKAVHSYRVHSVPSKYREESDLDTTARWRGGWEEWPGRPPVLRGRIEVGETQGSSSLGGGHFPLQKAAHGCPRPPRQHCSPPKGYGQSVCTVAVAASLYKVILQKHLANSNCMLRGTEMGVHLD